MILGWNPLPWGNAVRLSAHAEAPIPLLTINYTYLLSITLPRFRSIENLSKSLKTGFPDFSNWENC